MGPLGNSRELTDKERQMVEQLVQDAPVAVFGYLNRKFNEKGLCLQVATLEEEGKPL